ncbi:MAG TPA: hypothetical protein VJH04_01215 [archaeon]|nr:hypothetical protein [archaeon]
MPVSYMQKPLDIKGKIYPVAMLYAHRDGRILKNTIRAAGLDVMWDDFFSSFEVIADGNSIGRVDIHHDMHESTIYEQWHPKSQRLYALLTENGFQTVQTESAN